MSVLSGGGVGVGDSLQTLNSELVRKYFAFTSFSLLHLGSVNLPSGWSDPIPGHWPYCRPSPGTIHYNWSSWDYIVPRDSLSCFYLPFPPLPLALWPFLHDNHCALPQLARMTSCPKTSPTSCAGELWTGQACLHNLHCIVL